jgi:hypothetical protein
LNIISGKNFPPCSAQLSVPDVNDTDPEVEPTKHVPVMPCALATVVIASNKIIDFMGLPIMA